MLFLRADGERLARQWTCLNMQTPPSWGDNTMAWAASAAAKWGRRWERQSLSQLQPFYHAATRSSGPRQGRKTPAITVASAGRKGKTWKYLPAWGYPIASDHEVAWEQGQLWAGMERGAADATQVRWQDRAWSSSSGCCSWASLPSAFSTSLALILQCVLYRSD